MASLLKPNPVQALDGKAFGDGAVLGCDFVGEVVALGDAVTRFAKGDVVAALIWGGESTSLSDPLISKTHKTWRWRLMRGDPRKTRRNPRSRRVQSLHAGRRTHRLQAASGGWDLPRGSEYRAPGRRDGMAGSIRQGVSGY